MASPQAVRLFEQIYAKVDAQVRDIVTSMLPNVSVAAQDDGTVIANQHRILNFQGDGVTVTDDQSRRRVNVFVPGSPTTSAASTVVSTAGLEKVYTLTSGSLSSAPANWYTVGFNDSGWSSSVAMTVNISGSFTIVPGSAWVSDAASTTTVPNGCLIRRTFTLPAGSITSATLQINVDDSFGLSSYSAGGSLYLNGVNIASRAVRTGSNPTGYATITLSPGELVVGGTNVLAVHVYDFHTTPPDANQPHSVCYKLTVNNSSGGTDTRYIPYSIFDASGDLVVGTGADTGARLAQGSNGTFLGVSGGALGYYTPASGFSDPMTTAYDLIYRNGSNVTARLAKGSDGTFLGVSAGVVGYYTPPGASGAMTLISSQVLGSAAASVTFSSIPGTYSDLLLSVVGRSDAAVGNTECRVQLNTDTAANYETQTVGGFTNSSSVNQLTGSTYLLFANLPGTSAAANVPGFVNGVFMGYARTTFYKDFQANDFFQYGSGSNYQADYRAGYWKNTSAITSIKLFPGAGNFVTGSAFFLWGRT